MILVHPSITSAKPNLTRFNFVRTLVGIRSHLEDWPSPIHEPGGCQDVLKTGDKLLEMIKEKPVGLIVPLVEKVVLACGLAVDGSGSRVRGNSFKTAIICTDRLSQRRALEKTGLNPEYLIYRDRGILDELKTFNFPVVLKKPASARSEGVRIVYDREDLENLWKSDFDRLVTRQMNRLYQIGFRPDYDFLIEEFIEGEAWEVDGVSREKAAFVFRPLKQIWVPGFITEYQALTPPPGLIDAAIKAVEACGIKWSGWCVELKGSANNWKVIEVNARLGEDDKNFDNLISPDCYPVEKLCEVLS